MSTNPEVADLEDVFAKATTSLPIPTTVAQTDSQEKPSVEKESADALSSFEVDTTLLTSTNDDTKKDLKVVASSVLSNNETLSAEIREVLMDPNATLETDRSPLVTVEETSKTLQESTDSAVAGTVELAEEIMEAFANSKTVLDSENPVSADPESLQEELERLEQLAVERVREIEGELVNSSKQIAESSLNVDIPKEPKSIEAADDSEKTLGPEKVSSSELIDAHTGECEKDVDTESCNTRESEKLDSTLCSKSLENAPENIQELSTVPKEIEDSDSVVETKEVHEICKGGESHKVSEVREVLDASEGKESTSVEVEKVSKEEKGTKSSEIPKEDELIRKDRLQSTKMKEFLQEDLPKNQTDNKNFESEDKVNTEFQKDIVLSDNDVNSMSSSKETNPCEPKTDVEGQQVPEKNECEKYENIVIISENKVEDKENAVGNVSSNDEKKDEINFKEDMQMFSETNKILPTEQEAKKTEKKNINDIQNYDTEDDDLDVLEAFIVKSATNPEIAMCTADTDKRESAENFTEKYTEKSLIDDLTKTDDNSLSESESEIESHKETISLSEQPVSTTPQMLLMETLGNAIQNSDSSENLSKLTGNGTGRRIVGKQRLSVSNSKQLPLKKRRIQRPLLDLEEIEVDSNLIKGKVDKIVEKESISSEVKKRGRGRPPGPSKKLLIIPKSSIGDKNKHKIAQIKKHVSNKDNLSKKFSDDSIKEDIKTIKNSLKKIVKTDANKSSSGDVSSKQNIEKPNVPSSSSSSSSARKSSRNIRKKIISDDDYILTPLVNVLKKERKRVISSSSEDAKKQKRQSEDNKPSTSKDSPADVKDRSQKSFSGESASKERKKLEDNKDISSPINVKAKKGSISIPAPKNADKDNSVQTSESKTNKKDEKEFTTKKITDHNFTESNPHTTRSSKRVGLKKDSPSPKLNKKVKDKENVRKLSISTEKIKDEKRKGVSDENSTTSLRSSKSRKTHSDRKVEIVEAEKRKSEKRKISNSDLSFPHLDFKRNQVERETNVCEPKIEIENNTDVLSVSGSTAVLSNVYSDGYFFEFEDITFQKLKENAKQLILPSPLWGVQVSHEKNIVIFSRVCDEITDIGTITDKVLVFQESLKPTALIMNEPIDLPISSVRTFEDVVMLIRNFHTLSFCEGTGVKQRPLSKMCLRYLDVANPGRRCSQCLEERRRVLFTCARKLREKLRLLRAEKCVQ